MPDARSRSSPTAACALANALSTSSSAPAGSPVEALARELQLDHQRHQPLLRAVVQVAPEPPALGVARLDQPRARRAQRLQPRAQLDLQPRVLDRQRGGGARLDDQLGRLGRTAACRSAPTRRPSWSISVSSRSRGVERVALAVDVAALGQPVGDVERRVAERVGERVAQRRGRAASCSIRRADRRGAEEARAQQAEPGTRPGSSAKLAMNAICAGLARRRRAPASPRSPGRASMITAPSSSTGSSPRRCAGVGRPPAPQQQHDGQCHGETTAKTPWIGADHARDRRRRRRSGPGCCGQSSPVARREEHAAGLQRPGECSRRGDRDARPAGPRGARTGTRAAGGRAARRSPCPTIAPMRPQHRRR